MYTLPVGLASLISSTGQAWGDFAAASLLVSLPVGVLFIVFQRFLIEGLSAGGVKGDSMVNDHGVTKRYDDGFEAVQGLNLEVEDGNSLSCSALRLRQVDHAADVGRPRGRHQRRDRHRWSARQRFALGARGIGMVFQSYALYPHMSVADNLAFGLRMAKGEEKPATMTSNGVAETADMLG